MASAAPDLWREGCKHYKRNCKIIAPCCGNIYSCRICHDEVEDHPVDRYNIKNVVCNNCTSVQPISEKCKMCSIVFGKYYCPFCNLFDNDDKMQFHCIHCGICRIGGEQNYFHCHLCNLCLNLNLANKHTCVENASRSPCPVCVDDLHSSVAPLHVPYCGHLLHKSCYVQLKENDNMKCPICRVNF